MPDKEKNRSFFGKMVDRINFALDYNTYIDEDLFTDLEEILITSDIGMETTVKFIDELRGRAQKIRIYQGKDLKEVLQEILEEVVDKGERQKLIDSTPLVILVVGVNGGGKTTTIGKLGNMFLGQGKSVLLVAGDTFRAAAADQLEIWADRIGVDIVRQAEGADPSAVLFDGLQSAKASGTDVIICDTAGRLQNKKNLMAELEKMSKVISKAYPEAARETLLVLDATTGKNAISQVEEFGTVSDVTGVVITKLDGTAKGGIAITIADEFDIPIKFIGVGEGADDLREFTPEGFIGGIFDE